RRAAALIPHRRSVGPSHHPGRRRALCVVGAVRPGWRPGPAGAAAPASGSIAGESGDCMLTRRSLLTSSAAFAALVVAGPALAQETKAKLKVLATFSILGDFVENVGGDRVEVATLVGPDSDAHVYAPAPADAKKVADAKVVITNGLGFEGWMDRLVRASGSKAPVIVATKGIPVRKAADEHGDADPHAWQSVANAKAYAANIRDALVAADPAGESAYEANAAAYLAQLDALNA